MKSYSCLRTAGIYNGPSSQFKIKLCDLRESNYRSTGIENRYVMINHGDHEILCRIDGSSFN